MDEFQDTLERELMYPQDVPDQETELHPNLSRQERIPLADE